MGVVVGVTSSSATALLTRRLVSLRHVTSPTTLLRHSLRNHRINLTTTAATLDSAAASPAKPPEATATAEDVREWAGMLDIRVGRIVRAWKHHEADSLYVEEVDVGEGEKILQEDGEGATVGPSLRLICSGLVKFVPLHALQDKKVVVLANLKPRNMRGVKSYGMLMAASDSSHENVELLEPPESSLPGDRIWFGDDVDINNENLPDPASPNQIQKKKIWELVQPHLKTNASCVAVLGDAVMRTSTGVVRCRSLKDANVS